jgi:hypothetical protein
MKPPRQESEQEEDVEEDEEFIRNRSYIDSRY